MARVIGTVVGGDHDGKGIGTTDEFGRAQGDRRANDGVGGRHNDDVNRGRRQYSDNHHHQPNERDSRRHYHHPRETEGQRQRQQEQSVAGREHDNNAENNHDDNKDTDRLAPGVVIQGRVSRIESYGAFVDFGRGQRGLVHISQLAPRRVEKVEDVIRMGQTVYAVILEIDSRRIRLSMRSINQETGEENVNDRRDDSAYHRGGTTGGGPRGQHHANVGSLDRRGRQRQELLRSNVFSWRSPRDSNTPDILWARSPSPPKEKQSGKKPVDSESSDSDTTASSSSSSYESMSSSSEERRRRRKRRRGREKGRRRRRRRRSPSTSSSSSSDSSSGASDSDESSVQARKKKKHAVDPTEDVQGKELAPVMDEQDLKDAQEFKAAVQGPNDNDSDDDEVGPMPLPQSNAAETMTHASYGGALLPGEGQALAAYVQQNLRIPRRGEIGYSGEDIEQYEHQGYVMSGSRHARMNAVRIRKENQVYSAEEQRALALITMEENQQKEAQLMQDFRTMLKEKQRIRQQGSEK